MGLLERRELAGCTLEEVGEPLDLFVGVGDRQDVDLDRHRRRVRELVLVVGAEDRLRADDDDLWRAGDLARGADGVFELVPAHQRVSASGRSGSVSSPLMR